MSPLQPEFSIRWPTSMGKSGVQPSNCTGSYSQAIPRRSNLAAQRASSWLRKVVPPYSVMTGVCSGLRVWGATLVAHGCSAAAISSRRCPASTIFAGGCPQLTGSG